MTIYPVVSDGHRTRTNRPWEAPVTQPQILIPVRDGLHLVGLGYETAMRKIKEGKLPAKLIDGRYFFHVPTLEQWARDLEDA